MASRTIHLAITNELIKQNNFNNIERLRLGTIIPDSASDKDNYNSSHFKMRIGEGSERSYDLTRYRNQYGEEMKKDEFYLGYYLHLIQDLLYRNFVYGKYHWDPYPVGNVDRLHDDYGQVNAYVIRRYKLEKDLSVPFDFAGERINEVTTFNATSFIEYFKKDFEPIEYKERFFFTDSMTDEYIKMAVNYCQKEIDALKEGSHYFDEYEWSWCK